MIRENSSNIADAFLFASAGAAGSAWLADLDHIISIAAGVCAILAAFVSMYMHISRRMKKNKTD